MIADLRRLLWRVEGGIMHPDAAAIRLRAIVARLITEYRAEEASWSPLVKPGTRPADLRAALDTAIDAARGALTGHEFRACVARWQDASKAWDELRLAVAAHHAIDDARAALDRVEGKLPRALSRQLDVIDACARMLARAVALGEGGQYQQAQFVAAAGRRQADALLDRQRDGGRAAALQSRIVALRRLAAGSGPSGAEDGLLGDGLAAAASFVADESLVLAEQVIEGLERITAAARICLAARDDVPLAPLTSSATWRAVLADGLDAELARIAARLDTVIEAAHQAEAHALRHAPPIDHPAGGTP